jgi:hypothetical protein
MLRLNRIGTVGLQIAPWAIVWALAGCGGGEQPAEPAPAPAAKAAPTKADVIAVLRTVLPLLEQEKYDDAAAHFRMPKGAQAKALSSLIRLNEISAAGIDHIEKHGKFGKADEVFKPERAAYFAKKMGADASKCYGLHLDSAEVVAEWDGNSLKLVRLNNVGKLAK